VGHGAWGKEQRAWGMGHGFVFCLPSPVFGQPQRIAPTNPKFLPTCSLHLIHKSFNKIKIMKKLLMLFVCLALVVGVSAINQKDEKIPAAAKTGFAAKFPTAQKTKWSVEKPGEFEVEFTINGNPESVLVDAKGNLLETETEVKESTLPQAVKATIAKDFAGYKLDEIEKSTDAKGTVSYEMEAAKGKETLEISFDASGKLLKKEAVKEEKEKK
jgi:hypothetical protein